MAKPKRKTPKKAPVRASGTVPGGVPDHITEEDHEAALRILRAEYYRSVRSIVEERAEFVKEQEAEGKEAEDIAEALNDRVSQAVDGSQWVTYTYLNFQVLLCSDHHDAYTEAMGEAPVENGDINWAKIAYMAMEEDVRDLMDAEGIM